MPTPIKTHPYQMKTNGEFKGTKGPWHYDGGEQLAIFHPTEIGYRIAIVDHTFTGSGWGVKANDEWKHNARLIAAAPDLLEVLQQIWDCYETKGQLLSFDVSLVRQVLEKALTTDKI
jgi:hypothetical protein